MDQERTISLQLEKVPTGIRGLDEILKGGLPRGRTTLISGGPGSGKTMMGIEFLVRGAESYGEPGVFIAFEETEQDLAKNVASLGIDLEKLTAEKKILVDYVYIERSEIEETGVYDLEGLFVRLEDAIRQVGAKRVVLDTLEVLFSGFSNEAILRAELRRLFRWLNDHQMTAMVTGERGDVSLTRYGLEEYVSDCVILLEARVANKITTRLMRVVKYRGSSHGSDEYPFMIGDQGIWIMPITSSGLDYPSPTERISSGIERLDEMLGGKGFYRGSSILVSGGPGTGKSSLATTMAAAVCRRGEKCLYLAYEEAPSQIIRNMRSIGLDLQPFVDQGLLQFIARRPTVYGIETHLLTIEKAVTEFRPTVAVLDPLTNLTAIASVMEVKSMLVRLIDFLKTNAITMLFTSLSDLGEEDVSNQIGISSLMDAWITVTNRESNGERNRRLYVLKSRGMNHSSQVREYYLTEHGFDLIDVYMGAEGGLSGSARIAQQVREEEAVLRREHLVEERKRNLERKRRKINEQLDLLRIDLEEIEQEETMVAQDEDQQVSATRLGKHLISAQRQAEPKTQEMDRTPGGEDAEQS